MSPPAIFYLPHAPCCLPPTAFCLLICNPQRTEWRKLQGPVVFHPATIQRHQPSRDAGALLEIVSGKHHRLSPLGKPSEDGAKVFSRRRVEAREGLIEEEEIGIVQKRPGERSPLLEPARELPDRLVSPVNEGEEFQGFADSRLDVGKSEERSGKPQVLARAELTIKKGGVRDKTNPGFCGSRIAVKVPAVEESTALAGPGQRRQSSAA